MHIFNDVSEVPINKNTILTLGTFDGLHLGHKRIIDNVNQKAAQYDGRSFLVTFNPHPRNVVSKDFKLKLLTTLDEKIKILEQLGVQNLLVINFTKKFSQLNSDEFFLNYIVEGIGLREIIIGYDHHFGKGRSGNKETLMEMGKEYNFDVSTVAAIKIDDETVSSTKIRATLNEGDIKRANQFLGRPYSFNGIVVSGDKRGRALGFPTANIKISDDEKLLPKLGIYAVEFLLEGEKLKGVMSIGKRPTFYEAGEITSEVYIFNFNKDIYGKKVSVNIIEHIRGEEKFDTAEALIAQMEKDKKAAFDILNKK